MEYTEPRALSESETANEKKRQERLTTREFLLATLEKRLQIRNGYIGKMYQDPDDWSFIIKLAVLAEAAVTHAIVLNLKKPELADYIASLGNSKRLDFGQALGIFKDGDRSILSNLATIRNSYAHDVKNLESSLYKYFMELKPDRRAEFLNTFAKPDPGEKAKANEDLSGHAKYFKLLIYVSVIKPLLWIATQAEEAERESERIAWETVSPPEGLAAMFHAAGVRPSAAAPKEAKK